MADATEKFIESRRDPELLAEIHEIVAEDQKERGPHESQWDDNYDLFLGKHKPSSEVGSKKASFIVNRIQGAVINQVSVMMEETPKIKFVGRETNEPPDIFLQPAAAELVPPDSGLAEEQLSGESPIPQQAFEAMITLTQDSEMGPVPIFDAEDFVFVTDELAAEALTQELLSEAEVDNFEAWIKENIQNAVVVGHCDGMVQWDVHENRVCFSNIYPYLAWLDRFDTNTWKGDHYVVLRHLHLAEAKKDYPELEKHLDRLADQGHLEINLHGSKGGKFSSVNTDVPMVEHILMFRRNHPFPMSPDEAIDKGLVEPAIEVVEKVENGEVALEQKPAFELPDGTLVKPGQAKWPVKYGIRQVEMISDVVLYDGESDFSDFPVARNKNVDIPESCYGIGLPREMQDLQELYNRLWDIFHDHFKFYRSPQQVIPQSVYDSISEALESAYSSPVRSFVVPDMLLRQLGTDLIKTMPIPQLGNAIFQLIQMVGAELDRIAGFSDILRGETKSDQSALLFQEATQAAKGPIGFKAKNTAIMLKHLGKVAGRLIVDYLPMDEWERRNKAYPRQILQAMRSRLKRFGFDVSVEVSGSGVREKEITTLTSLLGQGIQVPTLLGQLLKAMRVQDADQIVGEFQQLTAPPPEAPQ